MVWSNKLLLASTTLILPEGSIDTVNGGYRAYNNFGDGLLYNINVAPKSTEVSRLWNNGNTTLLVGAASRLNGPNNTDLGTTNGTTANSAQMYSKSISLGGLPCYLGAIDELLAISARLKPSAATSALFQTGGSEAYTGATVWLSTETASNQAATTNMTSGAESSDTKANSFLVRPIRRFVAPMPFPIGTAMEGGYLSAYFTDLSSGSPLTYMLIVADKATEVTRAWDNGAVGTVGSQSRTNGNLNFNNPSTNFAAAKYCLDLVSGTKTDWYLPAIDELLAIGRMNASLSSGQQLGGAASMWSSTEVDASNAKSMVISSSGENIAGKTTTLAVRAIRRVLLP